MYFIKNNYVYKNNKILNNSHHILNENDIINICFNKYYYFLYRDYINNINSNKFIIFKKLKKFKNTDILKKDYNFINKIIFFKNDSPKYLEIDYLSMSLILLYKNINYSEFNYFNIKLLNVFLKRLYNWKFII